MKSVGELIVRVANLAEAEGRLAKKNVVRVLSSTVIFMGACVLLIAGATALCAAAFLGLQTVMPPGLALAIVSIVPLGLGLFAAILGVWVLGRDGKEP